MAGLDRNAFNRAVRDAQRKAEQQFRREVDRINRENKRRVDEHNRKVEAHNRRVPARRDAQLRKLGQAAQSLGRKLKSSSTVPAYTPSERQLAERVYRSVAELDPREYDTFLSYARIDGAEVAGQLRQSLEELGVSVWFDEVAIVPGRSQSLQMDAGLRKANSGIALLTPAYLAGRFCTERELGALLSKSTLIPVLHNVGFSDVREYSGILPDLAGFTTAQDSVDEIAAKIANAVLTP